MITSSARENRELAWVYPAAGQHAFTLRADGEDVGWLRYQSEAGVRSTAEWDGRRWTLEHTGGAHPGVSIYAGGSGEPVAKFTPYVTGGGIVSFSAGACYCWRRTAIWSNRWCFRSDGEGASVCVAQEEAALRSGGKVRVCGDAALTEEIQVLVLLAWYLRILAFERLTEAVAVCG